jgi:hypothetical protein
MLYSFTHSLDCTSHSFHPSNFLPISYSYNACDLGEDIVSDLPPQDVLYVQVALIDFVPHVVESVYDMSPPLLEL